MRLINFKIMTNRVRDYLSYAQFPMITYIFILQTGFDVIAIGTLIIISCCILAVLDWKFIYPLEQSSVVMKNPEWVKMTQKLDDVLKIVGRYEQDKKGNPLAHLVDIERKYSYGDSNQVRQG